MTVPNQRPFQDFTVLVKNIDDELIHLDEVNYDLDPDEEIDLCDPELPNGHYSDPAAPLRVLTNEGGAFTGATLYQAFHAGKLTYRVEPAR